MMVAGSTKQLAMQSPAWSRAANGGAKECPRVHKNATAGNRTRINCLEGNYANHYTTVALWSAWRARRGVGDGALVRARPSEGRWRAGRGQAERACRTRGRQLQRAAVVRVGLALPLELLAA